MTVDFSPLTASKLTQGELAHLLKVTRVAVNGWVNGTMNVHPMRKPRVIRLLQVIAQATQDGHFPLRDTPRDKRLPAIKKVLIDYLRSD